jgi:hypothetical protein
MRGILLLAVCVLVSACLHSRERHASQPQPEEIATDECYTVDLFTKVTVEQPVEEVPPEHRQFLGSWGGGAWNDVWCHDLLVTKVEPGGRVELVEMYAPYEPWNQPATAFRRVGHIDEAGNLRFAYGIERLSYRVESGKLIGARTGLLGKLHVELNRRLESPIPAPKPLRLAQLATTLQPGG